MVGMGDRPEVGRLVRACADDDQAAWDELVRRFAHPVMAVIRSYRLAPADAEDVYQTVWLRLVEHLDSLRDPEALSGWLRSTTMHECIRQIERRRRTVPVDPQSGETAKRPSADDTEAAAMRAELRVALRDGLAELSEEDQALLRLYALAEPYKNVSELLRMKTGSIGPTLGRSLERLRQTRALRRYLGTQPAAGNGKGGDQLELAPLDRR
jgi:RNA polymerase sigma factor (sigma-70 family)